MSFLIVQGDARLIPLADESVSCVITSPPYFGLRKYLPVDHPDTGKELGSEPTIESYVTNLVTVFWQVRRVLHRAGVLFLNLGDTYAANRTYQVRDNKHVDVGNTAGRQITDGLKNKDLCMIPTRVVLALQADGWFLRSMIPWVKRNPMPESVEDRPTSAIEYLFMLTKSEKYYYDGEAVKVHGGGHNSGNGFKREARLTYRDGNGARGRDDPWITNGSRARRNSDWFFERWQGLLSDEEGDPLALVVNTAGFRDAHFATFPPKLVEPLIKAGSSEKGVCSQCRAPWVREVEREKAPYTPCAGGYADVYIQQSKGKIRAQSGGMPQDRIETLGWSPSCQCNAPIQPALIVDIFGGAGTVGLMANKLGRNAISVDLSFEYCRMARDRITADAPLLHWGNTAPVVASPKTQTDFWAKER